MRTLLLGSDFMYNQNGDLVPIEINTNIGGHFYFLENPEEIFDFSELQNLITENGFQKVSYIGSHYLFALRLEELCATLNIIYEEYPVIGSGSVPDLEDDDTHLIIRSSYDHSAVVDTEYCANKINFLNLIKNQNFKTEFAYFDDQVGLVNNITTIPDNGDNPNFILKSIYPHYNKEIYPKLFKVNNQQELDVLLQNVDYEYFLMTFNYNSDKLFQNHIKVIRSLNLLLPPDLKSITIGQYTTITDAEIDGQSTYNQFTFELEQIHRIKYLTNDADLRMAKLLDTDKVLMGDGTFKTAIELQENDLIKTITIPNPDDLSIKQMVKSYELEYDSFVGDVEYSINRILRKQKISKLVQYSTIIFTDGTEWGDTQISSYLIVRDGIIRFAQLFKLDNKFEQGLNPGDKVVLINTSNNEIDFTLKDVQEVIVEKLIFSGWSISVENEEIFLTQTTENTVFAAIEENNSGQSCTYLRPLASGSTCLVRDCSKSGEYCCPISDGNTSGTCVSTLGCDYCLAPW
jgi:hypothetical protein